ncbi:MAG: hypothetical protein ACI4YB_00510 [Oscillospiraceae bacterium]
MITYERMNLQQKTSISLIKNDLKFIYTIINNFSNIQSNYIVSAMPIIGTIIDGTEDWIKSYNNSNKNKINIPLFNEKEQEFYEAMRSSIKFWNKSYDEIYQEIEQLYMDSDKYFSSICSTQARKLKLYDIWGADIVDGQFCGNTILCSLYVPGFKYGTNIGEQIRALSEIGGKYVAMFDVTTPFQINKSMNFSFTDFGGFNISPVGNTYSYKFILFCLLCQINFVLICVDKYILEECSTKLRFAYLQYYYISMILPEINSAAHTDFKIENAWISDKFRNAMAHYKIGIALTPNEIILDDCFKGLTQKYFSCDYYTFKETIISILSNVANQIRSYLEI